MLARVDLPPAAVTPVVLLHALPFDGRMWQAEQAWLPGPTLAPTLYRFGSTLEDWASGVLDVAPADPFVIVGCSIGGSCALEVARAAPERVLGIVLLGAKAGVRPEPGVRDEACQVLAERGMEAAWRTWWRPLFGPSTPPETLARAQALALDQDAADVARGVRAFHDRRDLTAFVERWRGPLAVISGEHDRTPSPATAARAAAVPGRTFHFVAGAGHYVNLECPREFRSLLSSFVGLVRPARRRWRRGGLS